MSELTELRKEIAGLFSGLAKSKNALRKIEARVAKALPAEKGPDVYEQVKDRYCRPFADLHPPDGHFFLMDGQFPVFRRAKRGEMWFGNMCVSEVAIEGPSHGDWLILRPAKRVVFVEDPEGNFTTLDRGPVVNYDKAMDHDRPMIRYRREDTP